MSFWRLSCSIRGYCCSSKTDIDINPGCRKSEYTRSYEGCTQVWETSRSWVWQSEMIEHTIRPMDRDSSSWPTRISFVLAKSMHRPQYTQDWAVMGSSRRWAYIYRDSQGLGQIGETTCDDSIRTRQHFRAERWNPVSTKLAAAAPVIVNPQTL